MNDVGKQEHKEKKAAVILAAGSGRRMNTPVAKQFLDLMGIPVFLHSVRLFDKIADKIVLVTSSRCSRVLPESSGKGRTLRRGYCDRGKKRTFPFIYGRSKGSLRLRFNYDT